MIAVSGKPYGCFPPRHTYRCLAFDPGWGDQLASLCGQGGLGPRVTCPGRTETNALGRIFFSLGKGIQKEEGKEGVYLGPLLVGLLL